MSDTESRSKVVFDCMIFLQGVVGNEFSPAAQCLELFERGTIELFVSYALLNEISDVLSRPKLQNKFKKLTQERTDELVEGLLDRASMIELAPKQFIYERDPKDEPYINLAIAAGAAYLVSWDNDLLDLMKDTDKGKAFRAAYPQINIIDPVSFLRAMK